MYNQRLDGIVVLDGEGECESCRGMEYTDIDSVIDDSNVKMSLNTHRRYI